MESITSKTTNVSDKTSSRKKSDFITHHIFRMHLTSVLVWLWIARGSVSCINIGCKWVFCTKYYSDGMISCHKSRLVAWWFSQILGVNYSHTFNPVVKVAIVRTVFSLVVINGWSSINLMLTIPSYMVSYINPSTWSNLQTFLMLVFLITCVSFTRLFMILNKIHEFSFIRWALSWLPVGSNVVRPTRHCMCLSVIHVCSFYWFMLMI